MGRQFREYAVLSAVQFPALSGNRGAKLSPMIVLRLALGLLGLGFLTIASWALVLDGLRLISDEPFRWISTGEMWFRLHPDSLQIAQPVIQRYILPQLWDPVIQTVLLWLAMAVCGVLGLAFALMAHVRPPPAPLGPPNRAVRQACPNVTSLSVAALPPSSSQ